MSAAILRIIRRVRKLVTPRRVRLKRIHDRREKDVCFRFETLADKSNEAIASWREEAIKFAVGETTQEALSASRETAANALYACISFYHRKCNAPYQYAMGRIARAKGVHGLHKRPHVGRTLR